ncbi:hypothetical protein CEH05_20290 [Halobacillus halophilus]|nr:hypothetical protein CEH05_20290 [Halobacillus halophilus]
MEGEIARLPWEKDLGETPQGVKTTEEAQQFPHRKASYFPSNPHAPTVTAPFISKLSLQQKGAFLLEQILVL